MVAPKPTLSLSQIKNLSQPMFIPAFCYLDLNPNVTENLTRRLGSLAWPSLAGFETVSGYPDSHAVADPIQLRSPSGRL